MKGRKQLKLGTGVLASAIVLSQLLCLSPLPVNAADSTVRLAGQAVINNVASSAGMTAEKRAEQVQQNLDNALVAASDRTPASVNITYVRGLPVVTLGGYQVITVDSESAKAAGTTPAVLAERWANALRNALKDQNSVRSYVAHLSGDFQANAPQPINNNNAAMPSNGEYYGSHTPQFNGQASQGNYGAPPQTQVGYNGFNQQYGQVQGQPGYQQGGYQQGRVVYAPAGLVIPATLATSIATQVAKPGDMIQANVSQAIMLGDAQIPMGSVLLGQVTDAKAGRFLGLAGRLGIEFNRLRLPDGTETPIQASLDGAIGKYDDRDGDGVVAGETWKGKTVQAGVRGAVGAGTGAALGTAVGAIAGGKRGAGRGAWSGTAIGAGVGVGQSLLARKGSDVTIPSGTPIKIKLEQPVSIAGGGPRPYSGAY